MSGRTVVGLTVEDFLALGTYAPCPGRTDTRMLGGHGLGRAGSYRSSA